MEGKEEVGEEEEENVVTENWGPSWGARQAVAGWRRRDVGPVRRPEEDVVPRQAETVGDNSQGPARIRPGWQWSMSEELEEQARRVRVR